MQWLASSHSGGIWVLAQWPQIPSPFHSPKLMYLRAVPIPHQRPQEQPRWLQDDFVKSFATFPPSPSSLLSGSLAESWKRECLGNLDPKMTSNPTPLLLWPSPCRVANSRSQHAAGVFCIWDGKRHYCSRGSVWETDGRWTGSPLTDISPFGARAL